MERDKRQCVKNVRSKSSTIFEVHFFLLGVRNSIKYTVVQVHKFKRTHVVINMFLFHFTNYIL